MSIVQEIESLSDAQEIVTKAWVSIPCHMTNPQAEKVWRIKKYIAAKAESLMEIISTDLEVHPHG